MTKARPHSITVFALFITIIAAYLIMAVKFPIAYIWATYEDLIGEWAQFYFFLSALIISARLAFSSSAYRRFFIFLSIACFYVVMEEISWGQRLFGWESPDFFEERNLQGETNIHNFFIGPYSTSLKAAVEYLLAAGLVAYGFIYPLTIKRGLRFAGWLNEKGLAAPPFYLWPFFCTAAFLELQIFRFNEAEVAEILVSLALMIMAIHFFYAQKKRINIQKSAEWLQNDSARLSVGIIICFFIALSLSVATTFLVQSSPAGKARIENRIENGIEKFASRYERYESWETAARLYEYLLELDSEYTPLLRKTAGVYKEMGNVDKFNEHAQKALEISRQRYNDRPGSAAMNRSLARTYRLIDDHDKAEIHLENALRIGLERVRKEPDDPGAAYSLGKTYELMGRPSPALQEYQRALKNKPSSKKYRKAYYRVKKTIEK